MLPLYYDDTPEYKQLRWETSQNVVICR